MRGIRNRINRLEQLAASRQSLSFELRVAGKPIEQCRRELATLLRQAASRPGLSDEVRRDCLQKADSLESLNKPASDH